MADALDKPVMIVGDCPPRTGLKGMPLTEERIGMRLCHLMQLKGYSELATIFDLAYVYDKAPPRWDGELACVQAMALGIRSRAILYMLIGKRVQDAFGITKAWEPIIALSRRPLAIPIPSLGRKVNYEAAEIVQPLMRKARDIARGETELSEVCCTVHGDARINVDNLDEVLTKRRLYECGCEALL